LAAIVAPVILLIPVGLHQIIRILEDLATPRSELAAGFVPASGLTPTGAIVVGFSKFLDHLTYTLGEPLFLALVISLPIGLYFAVKENNKWILFPFLWLLVISFLAPNNDFAWRFATSALIPSIIILAYLSGEFLSKSRKISRYITVLTPRTITAIFFITLILWVPMATITSSYIAGVSGEGTSYSRPEDRRDILSAFVWVRENASSDAIIAGTGDWRYYYAEVTSSIGPPFGRSVSESNQFFWSRSYSTNGTFSPNIGGHNWFLIKHSSEATNSLAFFKSQNITHAVVTDGQSVAELMGIFQSSYGLCTISSCWTEQRILQSLLEDSKEFETVFEAGRTAIYARVRAN